MLGVFVEFQYDSAIDGDLVAKIAEHAVPDFQGMPGLRAKYFTLDEARSRATNFYIWDDDDAARAFFSPALVDRVAGLYGIEPTVSFVDVVGIVDNAPA